MTERAKKFYEREFVPTITTAHTTPTARSLTVSAPLLGIVQNGPSDYTVKVSQVLLAESPLMRRVFNHYWDYDFQRCVYRIGDGTLTARSRKEVARITARLGGRVMPSK